VGVCNDLQGSWKATEATATYCLPSGTLYFDLFRKSNEANEAYWGLGFRVLMKNSALFASLTHALMGKLPHQRDMFGKPTRQTSLSVRALGKLCVLGTPLKAFFRGMFVGTAKGPSAMAALFAIADVKLANLQEWIMKVYELIQLQISDLATEIATAAAGIASDSIKEIATKIGQEIVKNFPDLTIAKDWGTKPAEEVAALAKAMAKTLTAALPISLETVTDTYTGMDYELGETEAKDKITFFTNTILGLKVGATVSAGVGIAVQGYYAFGDSVEC